MHVVWKRIVKMKFCVKSLYMVITLLCVNDVFSMKDNSYDNIFQQNDSRVVVVTGNHLPKEVESLDTKELYIEKKGKPLSQLGTLPETLEVLWVKNVNLCSVDIWLNRNHQKLPKNLKEVYFFSCCFPKNIFRFDTRHVSGLKNLKKLVFFGCNFKVIDFETRWDPAPNVEILDFSNNKISDWQTIPYLKNLEELNISHNELRNLPKVYEGDHLQTCLQYLGHLKKLDISHNKIEKLPEYLWLLKSLKKITIDEYLLNQIPEDRIESFVKNDDQSISVELR